MSQESMEARNDSTSTTRSYLHNISSIEMPSREEELHAVEQLKSSNSLEYEAGRGWLVKTNLKIVVTLAKKYADRGVSFMDLLQEGNIGLLKATETYDISTGSRFTPHAIWWIRLSMTHMIADQVHDIGVPPKTLQLLKRILQAQQQLFQATHSTPSDEELAAHLDAEIEDIREALCLDQVVLGDTP